ncbi:phosphatidylinositol-3,4,5-trisphosphate3-phosphatase [Schizosaccharomyces japonicus yFS275]|uniref:Phosphatidylinositol-3,4, 5-trisphosphate3-phosphatase n=1 Tax=Schizosaccharomyces japonicus (strain yFS275 / FY16936) TaxID=402676 RepID=B6K3E7_SCHJY|nr:phosphatidylinositol-3,4,5-trisphosphate3-phosphatase [Schizosaccharomyces japonicus yFS275]EEB08004.1 phosphatidylinositol-3,4,5-trisphosphate3-phosphatase [Schizosaccharomyces japonicus yFS275]
MVSLPVLIRRKVAQRRHAFHLKDHGVELDLAYIEENLIAMSTMANGVHKIYRNDIDAVLRFLEIRHPDRWHVLNLCAEQLVYDDSNLNGNVTRLGFQDHSPPPFLMLIYIVQWMQQFYQQHPDYALLVHCKAGKGRTGTVICSYLIATKNLSSIESQSVFTAARMTVGDGLTIPSQIRYVQYMELYQQQKGKLLELLGTKLKISSLDLQGIGSGNSLKISLHNFNDKHCKGPSIWKTNYCQKSKHSSRYDSQTILNHKDIAVDTDTDIGIFISRKTGFGRQQLVRCWINAVMEHVGKQEDTENPNMFVILISWDSFDQAYKYPVPWFETVTLNINI